MTVPVPPQTALVQKEMHISVLYVAIMHLDIIMEFGHVKAVKPSSKEASKVGKTGNPGESNSFECNDFCKNMKINYTEQPGRCAEKRQRSQDDRQHQDPAPFICGS